MKITPFVTLAFMLIMAGAFLVAQAQEHPVKTEHPKPSENPTQANDILSVVSEAGEFTIFLKAVKAAGLVEKLRGKGPFTVFAPTDAAFAKLPAGTLESLFEPANKAKCAGLLANHVIPGVIMAEDVKTMKATNVSGQDLHLRVDEGVVCVNDSRVVQPDLVAFNGVIHAIDTVIVPAPPGKRAADDKPKDHPAH